MRSPNYFYLLNNQSQPKPFWMDCICFLVKMRARICHKKCQGKVPTDRESSLLFMWEKWREKLQEPSFGHVWDLCLNRKKENTGNFWNGDRDSIQNRSQSKEADIIVWKDWNEQAESFWWNVHSRLTSGPNKGKTLVLPNGLHSLTEVESEVVW
jgi:hypothetical protein